MKTDKNSYEPMLYITSNPHQENLWPFSTTSPKKNDVGLSLCTGFIKVASKYLVSSAHKSVSDIYLLSTFATEYFYFCAFSFIAYFFWNKYCLHDVNLLLGSLRSDDGNVNDNATNQWFDWLNEEK